MVLKNSSFQSPARASKPKQNLFKRLAPKLLLIASLTTTSLAAQPVKQLPSTAVKKQTYTQDQLTFYKDVGLDEDKTTIKMKVSPDYILETGWFDGNNTFVVNYGGLKDANYFGKLQIISSPEELPQATFKQFLQYIGATEIKQEITIDIEKNTYQSKEPAEVEHLDLTPLLKPMPIAMKGLGFVQPKPQFQLTTWKVKKDVQIQVLSINNMPVAISLDKRSGVELSQTGGSDNVPESSLISPREAHLYIINSSHPIPSRTAVLLLKGISTRFKDSNYPAVSAQWENTYIDQRMGKPSTFMYELIVKNAWAQVYLKEFRFYYTNSKWENEAVFGSFKVETDDGSVYLVKIILPSSKKVGSFYFREPSAYLATK